jgi:hypothetical protein
MRKGLAVFVLNPVSNVSIDRDKTIIPWTGMLFELTYTSAHRSYLLSLFLLPYFLFAPLGFSPQS